MNKYKSVSYLRSRRYGLLGNIATENIGAFLLILLVCLALYPSKGNTLLASQKPLNQILEAQAVQTTSPSPSPNWVKGSTLDAAEGVPQAYLQNQMMKAGFSMSQIDRMMDIIGKCENSTFNPEAVSKLNANGSQDFGVMQLNSIHKARFEAKGYGNWDENVLDYKKNIDYAINEIMIPQKNFSAWTCDKLVK